MSVKPPCIKCELTDNSNDYKKEQSSDSHWQIIYKQEKEINENIELFRTRTRFMDDKIELMKTNESHSFTLELHRLLSSKEFKIYLPTILIVLIAYYIKNLVLFIQ